MYRLVFVNSPHSFWLVFGIVILVVDQKDYDSDVSGEFISNYQWQIWEEHIEYLTMEVLLTTGQLTD